MSMFRRLEPFWGLFSTVPGFACLTYVLFGPVYSSGEGQTHSLLEFGLQPVTIVVFCILSLSFVGEGVGALFHSRTRKKEWLVIVGLSTGILVIITFLSLASIGLLLLPSTAFALLTFIVSCSNAQAK